MNDNGRDSHNQDSQDSHNQDSHSQDSHARVRSDQAARLASWGIVALALGLVVPGLWHYQGPPMEEGFMLAFPQRILAGDLPHVDFLHLYGPGSLYVLAAAFKLFGDTLAVERTVGLVQHLLLVGSILVLLRPWGRLTATIGALTTLVITISPLGLSAMAWNGALGLAAAGLALCSVMLQHASQSQAVSESGASSPMGSVRPIIAGACFGAALLYRPDMAVAIGLALIALWWVTRGDSPLRPARRPFLLAGAASLVPMIAFFGVVGPEHAFRGMFLEPVFELRGGRSLPVPPSWGEPDGYLQKAGGLRISQWPLPMPGLGAQINLWFWLVPLTAFALIAGAVRAHRRESTGRTQTLLVAAAFNLGLVGQALQRPDTAHLSWVTCISFALVPALLLEAAPDLMRRFIWKKRNPAPILAALPVAVVLLVIIPFYPLRTYADLVGQSFGHNVFGSPMRRGDRVFYYGSSADARGAQQVIDELSARSRPGDRLLVGPYDMSKTPYSDAFFYYLFPDLTPATRYIEMDPGLADAEGSGLSEDAASADFIIQSDVWTGWTEANDSRFAGSTATNEVIAEQFCLVAEHARFRLLERCENSS